MTKFLVLGCQPYDFEQNGQRIQGATIYYLPSETDPNSSMYGTKTIEIRTTFDKAQYFTEGTGIYELGFSIVPGTRGTPKMVLNKAIFVKKVELNRLLTA